MESVNYFFLFLITLIFFSCHNLFDDHENIPKNKYLTNFEIIRSYTSENIHTIFKQQTSKYPELSPLQQRIKYGVIIYKISYNTTLNDKTQNASGLVCIPSKKQPFPLLSFQNGANTVTSNSPTENPNNKFYQLIEGIASTGFIVSIPDYLGFGSSSNISHPYLDKESTINTAIDMLRAIQELSKIRNILIENKLFLSGYSQGGWATLHIQNEIEKKYNNEFNLQASAPCSAIYSLSDLNNYILEQTNYPAPCFTAYLLNSYKIYNKVTTPIDSVFNSPYNTIIPDIFNEKKTTNEINSQLTNSVKNLFTKKYLSNSPKDTIFSSLKRALKENSIISWSATTPMRIFHGTTDKYIPYQLAKTTYNKFKLDGSRQIELIPLNKFNHSESSIPSVLLPTKWFLELTE